MSPSESAFLGQIVSWSRPISAGVFEYQMLHGSPPCILASGTKAGITFFAGT
jgi:hypothetical protein